MATEMEAIAVVMKPAVGSSDATGMYLRFKQNHRENRA